MRIDSRLRDRKREQQVLRDRHGSRGWEKAAVVPGAVKTSSRTSCLTDSSSSCHSGTLVVVSVWLDSRTPTVVACQVLTEVDYIVRLCLQVLECAFVDKFSHGSKLGSYLACTPLNKHIYYNANKN